MYKCFFFIFLLAFSTPTSSMILEGDGGTPKVVLRQDASHVKVELDVLTVHNKSLPFAWPTSEIWQYDGGIFNRLRYEDLGRLSVACTFFRDLIYDYSQFLTPHFRRYQSWLGKDLSEPSEICWGLFRPNRVILVYRQPLINVLEFLQILDELQSLPVERYSHLWELSSSALHFEDFCSRLLELHPMLSFEGYIDEEGDPIILSLHFSPEQREAIRAKGEALFAGIDDLAERAQIANACLKLDPKQIWAINPGFFSAQIDLQIRLESLDFFKNKEPHDINAMTKDTDRLQGIEDVPFWIREDCFEEIYRTNG